MNTNISQNSSSSSSSSSSFLDIHCDIKSKLDKYIEYDNIPNIIFYGNHGSGKKHILQYFLNKLYSGIDDKSEYIMNVNCAFGKGIQFIREDLKFFSKTNLFIDKKNTNQNNNTNQKKQSITIFKSVILLNADKLTTDAQSALRRCIEIFSNTTRFFIVTKDKTNILNPIQSRFHTVYIPYPYITNIKRCHNLYVYKKCNYHHTTSYLNNHKILIKKYLDHLRKDKVYDINDTSNKINNTTNTNTVNMIKCSKLLYNKGITGLEIIDFLHSSSFLEDCKGKYELLMKMDTYRTRVRNEQMFLYLLLCNIKQYCTFIFA